MRNHAFRFDLARGDALDYAREAIGAEARAVYDDARRGRRKGALGP